MKILKKGIEENQADKSARRKQTKPKQTICRKQNNIIEFKKIQLDGNRWLFWCSGFMAVLFSDNAGTKACIGSWKNLFKAQLSNALPN